MKSAQLPEVPLLLLSSPLLISISSHLFADQLPQSFSMRWHTCFWPVPGRAWHGSMITTLGQGFNYSGIALGQLKKTKYSRSSCLALLQLYWHSHLSSAVTHTDSNLVVLESFTHLLLVKVSEKYKSNRKCIDGGKCLKELRKKWTLACVTSVCNGLCAKENNPC